MENKLFWIQSTDSCVVGAEGTLEECEWQLKQWYPNGAPSHIIIIPAPWSLKTDYLKIKMPINS